MLLFYIVVQLVSSISSVNKTGSFNQSHSTTTTTFSCSPATLAFMSQPIYHHSTAAASLTVAVQLSLVTSVWARGNVKTTQWQAETATDWHQPADDDDDTD